MKQRRGVDKLNQGRNIDVSITLIANGPRGQDGNHWADTFTAATDDVITQLIDELNIRVELLQDCCIHTRHILRG
ncbi:hypothetical protein D3C76_1132760 [compost metagenome]